MTDWIAACFVLLSRLARRAAVLARGEERVQSIERDGLFDSWPPEHVVA